MSKYIKGNDGMPNVHTPSDKLKRWARSLENMNNEMREELQRYHDKIVTSEDFESSEYFLLKSIHTALMSSELKFERLLVVKNRQSWTAALKKAGQKIKSLF